MLRVLLSVASLALLATAQSGERVIAVRSLLPFLSPALQNDIAMNSALPGTESNEARDAMLPGDNGSKSDWLIKLLNDRHADPISTEELSLTARTNRRIVLEGTKSAVNACLADIDTIAATLTRSIEISAYEINVPNGELPPAFIDGQSLQATLDAAPPRWSSRAVTRSGGSVKLGDARWTAYLRDQDAEVAEKSKILDPKVDHLFQGKRLTVTVHALPNDELLLHGEWLTSERIEIKAAEIGAGRATVHLPMNRTAQINFGGRIQNGAGLVVAGRRTDEHGMEFVFLVRARYLSPPPPRADNMFVFPATAWRDEVDPEFDLKPAWFPGNDSVGAHPSIKEMPLLSPQHLDEFLAPNTDAIHENGVLVVYNDAAACARAERKLQQLVDAQLQQAELRTDQTTQQAASIVQPLLANMPSHAFLGTERAVIGDHEVEIAKGAYISNPIVFNVRSGVLSRAIAHPLGRTWHVESLWVRANQLPYAQHKQVGKPALAMQLPDYEMAQWPWDGQMQPNKTHALAPKFSVELRTQ